MKAKNFDRDHLEGRRITAPTDTHDQYGREIVDPTPLEVPLRFRAQGLSVQEQIARALASREVMLRQEARGEETLEASMDFGGDVEDDMPLSAHEVRDMREDVLRQGAVLTAQAERTKRVNAAKPNPETPPAPKTEPADPKTPAEPPKPWSGVT